ncbi:substrate-binding periplasmic protein [Undibacterium sp. TC4M20W]|uniref:substrate-binding periplasmic protein n=1 Tax=Undibacterium sp. TC4M20W TaxID=3413052 RepID=UPI003BEFB53B
MKQSCRLTISLWARNDSNINFDGELSRLAPYRFGAVRGISYGSRFDEFINSGVLNLELASDQTSAIRMALAQRFDILISNHAGAIHEMKKMGLLNDFKVLYPVVQEQETFFGFAKKAHLEPLRDELDQVLKQLKQNGYYDLTYKKYRDVVTPRCSFLLAMQVDGITCFQRYAANSISSTFTSRWLGIQNGA